MMNFIAKLFGRSTSKPSMSNKNEELEKAVAADNIQTAYQLLQDGADPNMKVFYVTTAYVAAYVDIHDYYSETHTTCLLANAKSEPMKRLLQHFGALPLEELEKRWKAEDEERAEKEEKKRQEKERQLAAKTEADNRFLDKVLR